MTHTDNSGSFPVRFAVYDGEVIGVTVWDGTSRARADVKEWAEDGCEIVAGTVAEARQYLFKPYADLLRARAGEGS